MPDEINPMRDLGFFPDKQVLIELQGFMVPGNPARSLCEHFIPCGGKFYDLLDRYGNVTSFVLDRADSARSDVMRMIVPFLKAHGATDYQVLKFFREGIGFSPGAEDCVRYLRALMPLYIDTVMYQHWADDICDRFGLSDCLAGATSLDLDHVEMPRKEAMALRKIAEDTVRLRLPGTGHGTNVPLELSAEETEMVSTLDDIFTVRLRGTEADRMIESTVSVGANEKAYTLLDIRKTTQIDVGGTMYVGSETTDFQVMNLIKDGGGLSLAYNASESAVHGCNVLVLSEDCTVAAFIASVFYDTGIQGVLDLAENWSEDYVRKAGFPDNNLRDRLLACHGKFPEAYKVDKSNADALAETSGKFRDKIAKKTRLLSAKAIE